MLTLDTAKEMEVSNRLDALQSIEGGAAYLSKIHKKLPDRITEPDRKLLALAAYNIGFGHLEDARILTQRMGGNPDLWKDVRENLPLLSQQKHYSKAKYGYARGTEPVVYVDNIQYYYHYLNLHFQSLKGQPTENMIKSDIKASWKEDSVPSI
jgi:membrane-bound lytic murein transglycosylase F